MPLQIYRHSMTEFLKIVRYLRHTFRRVEYLFGKRKSARNFNLAPIFRNWRVNFLKGASNYRQDMIEGKLYLNFKNATESKFGAQILCLEPKFCNGSQGEKLGEKNSNRLQK